MLILKWHDDDSKGYTDFIPSSWMIHAGERHGLQHAVKGPRGKLYTATCDCNSRDLLVDLDYRPYRNEHLIRGVLRLAFESESPSNVPRVQWHDDGDNKFVSCDEEVTISLDHDQAEAFHKSVVSAMQLTPHELQKRLASSSEWPERRRQSTLVFVRNPDVVAAVLLAAQGVCGKCNQAAPFRRAKTDEPYLEVHHKVRLADGGKDTVENAIALCPNCHRKMHYGNV